MKFTEAQLEKAFIDLLAKEGITHTYGVLIMRKSEEDFLFNSNSEMGNVLFINTLENMCNSLIYSKFLFNSNSEIRRSLKI